MVIHTVLVYIIITLIIIIYIIPVNLKRHKIPSIYRNNSLFTLFRLIYNNRWSCSRQINTLSGISGDMTS